MLHKRLHGIRFLLIFLAIVALILGAVTVVDANPPEVQNVGTPHVVQTRPGAAISKDGRTSNLTYHNGPLITGTTSVYLVYWGGESASDVSLMQGFMQNAGGTSYYNILTQYYNASGVHSANALSLAGTWTDTVTPSSNPVSDSQVQQEVTRAMQVNGWTPGLNKVFFVFTQQGQNICYSANSCSFTQFCGYHSHFASGSNYALYAAMPYEGTNLSACGVTTSPNNNINADSEINVTSHELFETVNDPLGSAWYDRSGAEIGDKCAWHFGTVASDGGNVTLNGHRYIVQQEWSNAVSGCTLTY